MRCGGFGRERVGPEDASTPPGPDADRTGRCLLHPPPADRRGRLLHKVLPADRWGRRRPGRVPADRAGRLLRWLPTPAGTPFTFCYALVLTGTSVFADRADPDLVHRLLRESSTDVEHLAHHPLLVLVASALWIAGPALSPYPACFLLVLTALERRLGAPRTVAVFLFGHVLATLLTEVPVAFAVAAGRLPESSLHRLDYGISFGVLGGLGALAGLLRPRLRWAVLSVAGVALAQDLAELASPLSNWGHLLALLTGVACWPVVRGWEEERNAAEVRPCVPGTAPRAAASGRDGAAR